MASLSPPSAQAGHDNKVLGKRKMEEEEEQHEEQEQEKEEEQEKSEASVEGPKLSVAKPRWNMEEDTMLIKHISTHGSKEWRLISEQLEGRSPSSCRMRWWGQLCPKLFKVYKEEKEKSDQASAAVPTPKPIFTRTVDTRHFYEAYMNWVMNRYRNRVHLAISNFQQGATSSYHPQPWSPFVPPPPPPSPSSPPTFIDFLGVGDV